MCVPSKTVPSKTVPSKSRSAPVSLQSLVAARLAALRKHQELTQDETARRLGIALRNYQRMESGRQNLTLQTIEKIAHGLGVAPHEVIAPPETRSSGGLHVIPSQSDDLPTAIPVFELDAAAGYVRSGKAASALGFTLLPGTDRLARPFVAQVMGTSMEPLIESGSWCLFDAAAAIDDGQVGLFEIAAKGRPEDGGSYVVKRLRRQQETTALHSVNRAYAPIGITEDAVRCVARFVGVVAPGR